MWPMLVHSTRILPADAWRSDTWGACEEEERPQWVAKVGA